VSAPGREPLRVALLDSIPVWGGGEKWCVSTARALAARGHHVLVGGARGSALEERASAAGLPLWSWRAGRLGWGLGARRDLARRLASERIEAVIASVGRDLRLAARALPDAGPGGSSGGGPLLLQRRGLLRPIRPTARNRRLYARVARVIVNCEAIGACMRSRADFVPRERFFVLPNGVERAAPPSAARRAEARDALGLPRDAALVAAIGRLAPMKGHDVLLAAWPAVLRAHPGALLAIAGDGEPRAELEALAARLGVAGSVRFLGFRADLAPVHAALDLFVLASVRDEGCNNALLEAMAHGRAAVVTDCGGLPELVVEGQTGRVVPVGDAGALGRALAELLVDDAARERMGEAAARRVEAEFTLERVTERLEGLLLELRG